MFDLQPSHLIILFLVALRCIIPLVLVVGVVLLIVWFVRRQPSAPTFSPTSTLPESPIEILKARYAKGEITKEQFEQMKKDLE